jgi:hypothetical protein
LTPEAVRVDRALDFLNPHEAGKTDMKRLERPPKDKP